MKLLQHKKKQLGGNPAAFFRSGGTGCSKGRVYEKGDVSMWKRRYLPADCAKVTCAVKVLPVDGRVT